MRKILLVLALAVPVILSGCSIANQGSCVKDHTYAGAPIVAGAPYTVSYPPPAYSVPPKPPIFENRTGRADGTISVPQHGFPCNQLIVIALTKSNLSLSASPASVYLPSPPSTATITGQLFDTTYASPKVEYFDSNGYLVGSVYANSVTGGGTSLQANMPDLSSVYSGNYQVQVSNMMSDGYYSHIVGTAPMTGWGRDRTDSDGDGWYDDEDCDPYDPSLNYSCVETCGGDGITPYTICQPSY
jgi:hypothetical protein